MNLRFCYKLAAEAGWAHDIETNIPVAAYAQVSMDVESFPDNYEEVHTAIAGGISKDHGIKLEYIYPISIEEYDLQTAENEELN